MNSALLLVAMCAAAAGAADAPSYEAAARVLSAGSGPVFDGSASRGRFLTDFGGGTSAPYGAVAALTVAGGTAAAPGLYRAPARAGSVRPEPPPPGGAKRVAGRISQTALRWLTASFFGVLGAALAIGAALLVPGAGLWAPALIGFAIGSLVGLLALKSKKKKS